MNVSRLSGEHCHLLDNKSNKTLCALIIQTLLPSVTNHFMLPGHTQWDTPQRTILQRTNATKNSFYQ